jgi:hypothetical protein
MDSAAASEHSEISAPCRERARRAGRCRRGWQRGRRVEDQREGQPQVAREWAVGMVAAEGRRPPRGQGLRRRRPGGLNNGGGVM